MCLEKINIINYAILNILGMNSTVFLIVRNLIIKRNLTETLLYKKAKHIEMS